MASYFPTVNVGNYNWKLLLKVKLPVLLHRHLLNKKHLSVLIGLLLPSIRQVWNTRKINSVCVGNEAKSHPKVRKDIPLISGPLNPLEQDALVTCFKGGSQRRPSIPSGIHILPPALTESTLHSWSLFSVLSAPAFTPGLSRGSQSSQPWLHYTRHEQWSADPGCLAPCCKAILSFSWTSSSVLT